MLDERMIGPGRIRRFVSRWCIEFDLKSSTPICLGNGAVGDYVDLPLFRDEADGSPLLTGSSLCGAMRDYLCDIFIGDRIAEHGENSDAKLLEQLFGARHSDNEGSQSSTIFFDARGKLEQSQGEVRDGVRINSKTGIAEKHGKFDIEVCPPGVGFDCRVDLLVPAEAAELEPQLLACLLLALEGLKDGKIRLGAKTSRGFGQCTVASISLSRFQLNEKKGWLNWLSTGLSNNVHISDKKRRVFEIESLLNDFAEWQDIVIKQYRELKQKHNAKYLELKVPIRFGGGVLIRAPQTTANGADVKHLSSAGQPVLSGTSISGALRHRAERIAAIVRGDSDSCSWVERLFGSQAQDRSTSKTQFYGSRLIVDEVKLSGGVSLQHVRIKLDRFTQAPVAGALLEEEVLFCAKTNLSLRLKLPQNPDESDALSGFLLLIIKDLLLGDVPLGGSSSIGRGVVLPDGPVTLTMKSKPFLVSLTDPPAPELQSMLDKWVTKFHDHPLLTDRKELAYGR